VAHGGFCVARHEGRVVFVRHALPGERVTAVVTEGGSASRFLRADAVEVHEAAAGRVEPPCPYARPGRCGGCDWQHAALPLQRELKATVVREQLAHLAGLAVDPVVEPVPGDVDGLGWRTRVRFAVDGEHRLGLRKHRSHAVVPIERCWIADPAIDGLGVTRAPWPGAEAVEAVVSSGGDRSVVVTPPDAAVVRQPPALEGLTSLVAGGEGLRQVRGRTWVREHAAGRDWRVSVGGFWQVHPGAAQALVDAVLAGISPQAGEVALDLYAGSASSRVRSPTWSAPPGRSWPSSPTRGPRPTPVATCTPCPTYAWSATGSSARFAASATNAWTSSSWTRPAPAPADPWWRRSPRWGRGQSRTSPATRPLSPATWPPSPGWATASRRCGPSTASR
jgi:hypothetical protein